MQEIIKRIIDIFGSLLGRESFIKDPRAIEYTPPTLFNKEQRFITIKNEHKANI